MSCNTQRCPQDCVASTWLSWSRCSADCGPGVMSKRRAIALPAAFGGLECPVLVKYTPCTQSRCPVHCKHTWSAWSKCTKSCDSGFQRRYAQKITSAMFGGRECPDHEERVCDTRACPTANPTKAPTLQPTTSNAPTHNPTAAPTTSTPTNQPTRSPTARPTSPSPIDCIATDFSEWSACSQECGGGVSARQRLVATPAQWGGKPCPALYQNKDCNTQKCKTPCTNGKWSAWSKCDKTCGGGMAQRTRTVAAEGCANKEQKVCNTQECPRRKCDIVGAKKCSHVSCKAFKRSGGSSPFRINIQHHHREQQGGNHCCAFDDQAMEGCSCVCW